MKQSESSLQSACIRWFGLQYPDVVIFAIPNGGSRNVMEAANLKRQGVLAGVSDLFIMRAATVDTNGGVTNSSIYTPSFVTFHGLFIELKVGSNKPTEAQDQFISKAQTEGYLTAVCWTLDEFMETVNGYLSKGMIQPQTKIAEISNRNGARLNENPKTTEV